MAAQHWRCGLASRRAWRQPPRREAQLLRCWGEDFPKWCRGKTWHSFVRGLAQLVLSQTPPHDVTVNMWGCMHPHMLTVISWRNGILDNFSWITFSQRSIKMKNNGENRTFMRSRIRSKINFKVALSCWLSFQNTAPCCDVKTVPKHQPSGRRGLR